MLYIFSGRLGSGKTTLARGLAEARGAVLLRIDSIEWWLKRSVLPLDPPDDAGYLAAYAVAEDNLRLGRSVIADCVNPIALTREAWMNVARETGAPYALIEIRCSDEDERRRRFEARPTVRPGVVKPPWAQLKDRPFEPWSASLEREVVVIETAGRSLDACLSELLERV